MKDIPSIRKTCIVESCQRPFSTVAGVKWNNANVRTCSPRCYAIRRRQLEEARHEKAKVKLQPAAEARRVAAAAEQMKEYVALAALVRAEYEAGLSLNMLGRKYGYAGESIGRALRAVGVPIRSRIKQLSNGRNAMRKKHVMDG